MMNKINSSNYRYFRVREEDRQEIFMTDVTEIIKIEIDQMIEIGEFHLVVEYSVDRTIKIGLSMIRTTGKTLGEEILEEI